MSNIGTINSYTSSTGLTTVKAIEYYNVSDVPNFSAIRAAVVVDFAAETLMNPAGSAVLLNIPCFSVKAESFAPVTVICECIKALTQGGTSTSTTLVYSLATATTPSTVAITTGTTPVAINTVGTFATGSALTGRVATTGTAILTAGQFETDPIYFTSTTSMLVKPNQTCYLQFTPSGTLTTSTTYTGTYKFYILGGTMTSSAQSA